MIFRLWMEDPIQEDNHLTSLDIIGNTAFAAITHAISMAKNCSR